jgi:hypothetical protein
MIMGKMKPTHKKARELGWVPLEEFKGDPLIWCSATAFIRAYRNFAPSIAANKRAIEAQWRENERLQGEITRLRGLLK